MYNNVKFKYFLLNEDATYLAGRLGDVLNAIQDIQQNANGMGTKQLVRNAERVVNQIRRILHTNWGSDSRQSLEVLQRVGVAIKKAIEEKSDLQEMLTNCANEMQDMLARMGLPLNSVGTKGTIEKEKTDQTAPPQGKEENSQKQTQQTPQQFPAAPDLMGGMSSAMPNDAGMNL